MNILRRIRQSVETVPHTVEELGFLVTRDSPEYSQCVFFTSAQVAPMSPEALAGILRYQRMLGNSVCLVFDGRVTHRLRWMMAYFNVVIEPTGIVGEFKYVKNKHGVLNTLRVSPELYNRLLDKEQDHEQLPSAS